MFSFLLNDVSYEYPSSRGSEIASNTACREYSFLDVNQVPALIGLLGLDLVLVLDFIMVLCMDGFLVLGMDEVLVLGLDRALVLGLELTLDLVLVPVLLEDED